MPVSELQQIVGRTLIGATGIADGFIDDLSKTVARAREEWKSPGELLEIVRNAIADFEPLLAEHLSDTVLSAWINGYDTVAKQFPLWLQQEFTDSIRRRPPQDPPTVNLFGMFDREPRLRLLNIENAAKRLFERKILTKDVFESAEDSAKTQAFTIAGGLGADTIDRFRGWLYQDLMEGTSLQSFKNRVEEHLGTSPIAPNHLETVYRTNVQASFRDGRETLRQDPLVAAAFPYQEYMPIDDGRVRHEHLMLGKLGLDGTGIYRIDDEVWSNFTPPWDYNSVASGEKITTSHGEVAIESVSVGDVVLTHCGNWRPVLGIHSAEGPSELVLIQCSNGRSVRVTPEHRVFTQNGWIEAARLNVGDKVHQVANPSSLDFVVSVVNERAKVERFNDSIMPIQVWPHLRALDFNANTQSWQKYIQPIRRGGFIESVVNASQRKLLQYHSFVKRWINHGIDVFSRINANCFYSPLCQFDSLLSANTTKFFSGGKLRLSFGMPLVVGDMGLGSRQQFDILGMQHPSNCPERNTSRHRDILQRDESRLVFHNGGFGATRPLGVNSCFGLLSVRRGSIGLLDSQWSIPMKTMRVVSVQRQLYHGLVHDLSVDGDESFVVNGMAVSNCRCSARLLTLEQAARAGVKEAQQWLKTGRPPLRPEFRYATIPFSPNPGWGSRGNVGVIVMSTTKGERWITIGAETIADDGGMGWR